MLQKRSLLTAISCLLLVIVSGSLPVIIQPIQDSSADNRFNAASVAQATIKRKG